jgi:GDP-4-dehydro-6-deoxy-D-mannose reductase
VDSPHHLRVLIFGGSGFAGRQFQALLSDRAILIAPDPSLDIRDFMGLVDVINAVKPAWVVHLAAVSNVPDSFVDPRKTFEINFTGTLNILLALKENRFSGRFLYVSSGQVYGVQPNGEAPFEETCLPKPNNPYAVSKLASEMLCGQWAASEAFDVVMARPFNHIGPGQTLTFAVPNFARQIAEIKHGLRPAVLDVGNIDTTRDFTDVRDVVRAYDLLLRTGESGQVYNICSGVDVSMRAVIERLAEIAGITLTLQIGLDRVRTADQTRMVGNARKIFCRTGWAPNITLEESLKSIFEDQEKQIICRK